MSTPEYQSQDRSQNQQDNSSKPLSDQFLVCGLGGMGQHCVAALKAYGVRVSAIELVHSEQWEIPNFLSLLEHLIIGDCRDPVLLNQVKIQQFRCVLIVTSNERINAETALIIRKLSPHSRLVVRSSKENLNQLLSQLLGNLVAYEPTQLPAFAFALAALGTEILGFFNLEGYRIQIIQRQLSPNDPWCNRSSLQDLNSRSRRLICHLPKGSSQPLKVHAWEPNIQPSAGDTIIYVEVLEQSFSQFSQTKTPTTTPSFRHILRNLLRNLSWQSLQQQIIQYWQQSEQQPLRRVALFCGLLVFVLSIIGTLLFRSYYPQTTYLSAFYGVAILLLGGYADIFGKFEPITEIPGWLQLFALGLTLAGTALVGVLYALLTQALLSARFQLTRKRPPIPQNNHLIIIGLGRVGQRIAVFLQEFKQAIVGVTENAQFDFTLLPSIPLIISNYADALNKVNLSTARSVVIVTDDEILNLEIGLMVRNINPHCHVVIRTMEQSLSESLTQLLPHTQALCAYEVAAEAFAGAAFGENILNLFRLGNDTILVTEYQIEVGDTLHGLLLSEVAYGYGLVPILHQSEDKLPRFIPSDDILLSDGDRMVVLATTEGLRAVEQGINIAPKTTKVHLKKARTSDAAFEGANVIVRISGCQLSLARNLMNHLPATLPIPLYKHQAHRLVQELRKSQVFAHIL
ncbi:NAD-binding protein [Lyngbya sp. PCC 8106]|uniref:NAD-binding protein n=1 Tax=Lyngbya sp. (strain PCC 8106) TaxID=313612 RepID=UPI0000EACAC1|nr:NAD-binding protein [Lyngbya sp. PCC 8106]EAW34176.1 TrkA-N [Lyngbya sp. PCC 8106]